MSVPGSVVLAKVKGYAPWPAMVLNPEVLPENVLSLKPKHGIYFTPVRFFADDTYIWIKNGDLKELSADAILKYLEKHDDSSEKEVASTTSTTTEPLEKRDSEPTEPVTTEASKPESAKKVKKKSKKELLLLEAYKLANEPPSIEVFVKYGSSGEPPLVEEPEVEEEESPSDSVDDDEEDEDDDDSLDDEIVQTPKKSRKRNAPSKPKTPAKKQKTSNGSTKTKAKSTPAKKAATPKKKPSKADNKRVAKNESPAIVVEEDDYDSDWGVEETAEEQRSEGNYIFEDSKKQKQFITTFPASQEIASQFNKYKGIFEQLELGIAKDLLFQEKGFEKDVKQKLNEIEKVVDYIPKVLITKSRLLKVFIVTVRNPNFGDNSLRKQIQSLLQDKIGLAVRVNNEDDFLKIDDDIKKYNNTSTPVVASAATSKNGTPAPAI